MRHNKGYRKQLQSDSLPHNIGYRNIMREKVTKQSKTEYIQQIRSRYAAATKLEQGMLLDEIIKVTGYHRKSIIRQMNKRRDPIYPKAVYGHGSKRAGRPPEYNASEIRAFLTTVWHSSDQICSKRMKEILPLWLGKYQQATGIALSLEHQVLITTVSPSTIDRLLTHERKKYRTNKGCATTRPGTYLKNHIPINTDQWNETRPGFLEVDTVAHCGTSLAGQFAYTLNTVDIASQWTEPRAIWGKGEKGVVDALEDIEESLPFALKGIDSDNGSEFINYHVERHLTGRKRPVAYTRSREYKKNDNAHIEGRNWTHVRQLLGYERFDNPTVVALMNDLYSKEFSLWVNIFLPSMKLQSKERIGSQIKKRHDKAQTPCQRLLASPYVMKKTKERLRELQRTLNPFLLHQAVEEKVKDIFRHWSEPLLLDRKSGSKGGSDL